MAAESVHVNTTRKINVLSKSSTILDGNWNYEKHNMCLMTSAFEKDPCHASWYPGQGNYQSGLSDLITYTQTLPMDSQMQCHIYHLFDSQ